jgi:hypothetical protein
MKVSHGLTDSFLLVQQKFSQASPSNLISFLDREFIFNIENSEDKFLIEKKKKIYDAVCKILADYDKNKNQDESIFEAYNEALFYSYLKSKIPTESLDTENTKTPDFKVYLYGNEYYFEYKALKMLGGRFGYDTIAKEAAELAQKPHIASYDNLTVTSTEQVIQPHNKHRGDYNPRSVKMVIENIIDKATQNIKEGQFSLGPTVLVLDLNSQLSIFDNPGKEITEKYAGLCGESISGVLYHVAAGSIGDEIYCHIDFEGERQFIEKLEKQGILREFPFITAVLFHSATFGKSEGYVAIYRNEKEEKFDGTLIKLLKYLTIAHGARPVPF